MEEYNVIGAMSGTSCDGLDLAFCNFIENSGNWKFQIIQAVTIPYPDNIKNLLIKSHRYAALEFLQAHNSYGDFIAGSINTFLSENKLKADLIASHGHTIYHQPENRITFQLGNGAIIAGKTGITTVSDFRSQDVANGGQGAPLVPIGDELLFGNFTACLNLGGFSNISFKENGIRVAFDICPVNIVINYVAGLSGKEMDEDGKMAKSGKIIEDLFNRLNHLDFYSRPYPKSLGREWVEKNIYPLLNKNFKIEDIQRTFVEHIAFQLSLIINKIKTGNIFITGGGAFNKFLVERIKTGSKLPVIIPDPLTVNYKEALIFAFLGVLRLRNEINCLCSVTGAKSDISTGVVHLVQNTKR